MPSAVTVTSPLGPDKLRFRSLQGFDALNDCFAFHVVLETEDLKLDPYKLLGEALTVTYDGASAPRHFHGYVDEIDLLDIGTRNIAHELTLRPWLWFLGKTTENRIFQHLSVPEIVEQVFGDYPDATFESRLTGNYPTRDYCVQYGETDLAFVQRLLEHEGINYFFEHADGAHTLVLIDAMSGFAAADPDTLPYTRKRGTDWWEHEMIGEWRHVRRAVSGSFSQTDYDFTKPAADLAVRQEDAVGHRLDDRKLYEYPGSYVELKRGDTLAGVRIEETKSGSHRIRAMSNAERLAPATVLTVTDHPCEAENDAYLILSVASEIEVADHTVGDGSGAALQTSLELVPTSLSVRPDRRTPRPEMRGPQTAVVTGPAGAEIHTDEHARVKVQFHWDRHGAKDENTTCFVRVSSAWAGAGWGFLQVPRIGQEVIVDFLEGDPDQPIITGRVYNGSQTPPFGMPGSATQSGIKTNSSPGGGGWNELRFEDKKGSEEVYFQAEKDHNELVKNDESRNVGHDMAETVGNDSSQSIGHDRTEDVGNDKATSVGKNRTVKIGVDDTENVGANRSLTVGANETITVGINSTETIKAAHTQIVGLAQTVTVGGARTDGVARDETRMVGGNHGSTVAKDRSVNVGGGQTHGIAKDEATTIGGTSNWSIAKDASMTVGGAHSVTVAKDEAVKIDGARSLKVAKSEMREAGENVSIKAGKEMVIEAGDSLTIKCGKATIALKKDGTINIDCGDLTITASKKVDVKASSDVTVKGSKVSMN